jgi:hypothetical protein
MSRQGGAVAGTDGIHSLDFVSNSRPPQLPQDPTAVLWVVQLQLRSQGQVLMWVTVPVDSNQVSVDSSTGPRLEPVPPTLGPLLHLFR